MGNNLSRASTPRRQLYGEAAVPLAHPFTQRLGSTAEVLSMKSNDRQGRRPSKGIRLATPEEAVSLYHSHQAELASALAAAASQQQQEQEQQEGQQPANQSAEAEQADANSASDLSQASQNATQGSSQQNGGQGNNSQGAPAGQAGSGSNTLQNSLVQNGSGSGSGSGPNLNLGPSAGYHGPVHYSTIIDTPLHPSHPSHPESASEGLVLGYQTHKQGIPPQYSIYHGGRRIPLFISLQNGHSMSAYPIIRNRADPRPVTRPDHPRLSGPAQSRQPPPNNAEYWSSLQGRCQIAGQRVLEDRARIPLPQLGQRPEPCHFLQSHHGGCRDGQRAGNPRLNKSSRAASWAASRGSSPSLIQDVIGPEVELIAPPLRIRRGSRPSGTIPTASFRVENIIFSSREIAASASHRSCLNGRSSTATNYLKPANCWRKIFRQVKYTTHVVVNKKKIKVVFWDIPVASLDKMHLTNDAGWDGAILCGDVGRFETFKPLATGLWKTNRGSVKAAVPGSLPAQVVGLKGDTLRTYGQHVANEELAYLSETCADAKYITVSSKLNDNVRESFDALLELIHKERRN
ncbi:unnamed protein product [Parascedosporium putredinis]|uniref:Uncharacterized protein n=1 Tax=Parascedosporium putredinis TaxID=1442378 RepID=A0A9P1H8F1_9PEZI|nr:unnamed protein product [Parascedosporium putredinis]CAI7999369.1 unnamed protein product [Parascedosporium putredinis]